MGTFDLFRKMCQSSYSESERQVSEIQYDINWNFYSSPSYHKIELNGEDSDVQITDESSLNKNPNRKRILSLPTGTFKKGDLVYWNSAYWMITNIDADVTIQYRGIMEKCNNVLKNYDSNGVLHTEPCIIETKVKNTDFQYDNDIILPDGVRIVMVQYNTWTSTFVENQRFMFGGQAWKCTQLDNFQKSDIADDDSVGVVYLTLTRDDLASDDDVANNIPNINQYNYTVVINQDNFQASVGGSGTITASVFENGIITTKSVTFTSLSPTVGTIVSSTGVYSLLTNGSVVFKAAMSDNPLVYDTITVTVTATVTDVYQVVISPSVTEIYEDESETYSAYLYKNNVVQVATVTPVASGMTTDYYSLNVVDVNHFTVTNKQAYSGGDLLITCTSGAYSETISISLKGAF